MDDLKTRLAPLIAEIPDGSELDRTALESQLQGLDRTVGEGKDLLALLLRFRQLDGQFVEAEQTAVGVIESSGSMLRREDATKDSLEIAAKDMTAADVQLSLMDDLLAQLLLLLQQLPSSVRPNDFDARLQALRARRDSLAAEYARMLLLISAFGTDLQLISLELEQVEKKLSSPAESQKEQEQHEKEKKKKKGFFSRLKKGKEQSDEIPSASSASHIDLPILENCFTQLESLKDPLVSLSSKAEELRPLQQPTADASQLRRRHGGLMEQVVSGIEESKLQLQMQQALEALGAKKGEFDTLLAFLWNKLASAEQILENPDSQHQDFEIGLGTIAEMAGDKERLANLLPEEDEQRKEQLNKFGSRYQRTEEDLKTRLAALLDFASKRDALGASLDELSTEGDAAEREADLEHLRSAVAKLETFSPALAELRSAADRLSPLSAPPEETDVLDGKYAALLDRLKVSVTCYSVTNLLLIIHICFLFHFPRCSYFRILLTN